MSGYPERLRVPVAGVSQARSATRAGSGRCLAAQLDVLRGDGNVSLHRRGLDSINALRLGPMTTETTSIRVPGLSMIFPAVSSGQGSLQAFANEPPHLANEHRLIMCSCVRKLLALFIVLRIRGERSFYWRLPLFSFVPNCAGPGGARILPTKIRACHGLVGYARQRRRHGALAPSA